MFNRFCFGALVLVGLAGLLTGCSTTSSPTDLTTIVISPGSSSGSTSSGGVTFQLAPQGIAQGHAQFTAIGYYGHAGHQITKDITDSVTWTSSQTQIVGICSNGSSAPCTPAMDGLATVTGFTTNSAGTVAWYGSSNITASAPGFNGTIVSNTAVINVTACTLCSGGSTDITAISVIPATQTVASSDVPVQYEAIGTDASGVTHALTSGYAKLTGSTILWASSDLQVASVTDATNGLVTTGIAGTTTISVTFTNADGTGQVGSAPLVVTATTGSSKEPIVSMTVSPGSQTATSAGQTLNFLALATTSTGTTVNLTGQSATINGVTIAPAVWTSSNSSVAKIVDQATGSFVTTGPGATVITATATNQPDGTSVPGQANLTVSGTATSSAEPLVSLAISPASQTSLTTGTNANVNFVAIGTTSAGTTVDLTSKSYTLPGTTVTIPAVVWSSSNQAVATIGAGTGIATPKNTGATAITATVTNTADGSLVQAVAAYTVSSSTTEEPLLSMSIVPSSVTAAAGQPTQLLAIGTFSASAPTPGQQNMAGVSGYTVKWYSSNPSVATICSAGQPAPACTGVPDGLVTGVTAGTTAITAIATNTADKSSVTATGVFTVSGPAPAAISTLSIVPASQSIAMPEVGQPNPTVNLVVIGANGAGLQTNVTNAISWTSSNPAVVPTTNCAVQGSTPATGCNIVSGANSAVVTAIGPGTTTITASYTNPSVGGVASTVVTQTATLTVTGPAAEPLLSLAILPNAPSVQFPGQTTQLTVIGTLATGATINLTSLPYTVPGLQSPNTVEAVTWTSSNPSIATVCTQTSVGTPAICPSGAASLGLVTAVGKGTAAITATTTNPDGTFVYATAPFTVQAGSAEQMNALTIIPSALSLSATGQPGSLIALATSSVTGLQEDVTGSAQLAWSSSNQAIATVSSLGAQTTTCALNNVTPPVQVCTLDPPGVVKGVSVGSTNITAEWTNPAVGGTPASVVTTTATVTVTSTPAAEPLLAITVLPATVTTQALFGTGQFLAFGTFSTAPTSLDITNGFFHAGFSSAQYPSSSCTDAYATADAATVAADVAQNPPLAVTNLPYAQCAFVPVTWVSLPAPFDFPINSAGAAGATGGLITAEDPGTEVVYAVASNPDGTLVYSSPGPSGGGSATFSCPYVAPTYAILSDIDGFITYDFNEVLNPGSCNGLTVTNGLLSTLTVFDANLTSTGLNQSNWLITAPSATNPPVTVIHCGPGSLTGGSVCEATYPNGQVVTVTAPAEPGVSFGGWSDNCTPTAPLTAAGPNSCQVVVGGGCTYDSISATYKCSSSNISVGAIFN